jgi:hypothetical protein
MAMTVGSFDHSHAHEMWRLARAQHEDAVEEKVHPKMSVAFRSITTFL